MLLAIDNGNTNVKFALVDGAGAIVQRWRIATDVRRTADEYAVWLDQLLHMEGYERGQISAVVIATVVPRALHNLQVLAQKYFGTEALIAGREPLEWGIARRPGGWDRPGTCGSTPPHRAVPRHVCERATRSIRRAAPGPTPPHPRRRAERCRNSPPARPPPAGLRRNVGVGGRDTTSRAREPPPAIQPGSGGLSASKAPVSGNAGFL